MKENNIANSNALLCGWCQKPGLKLFTLKTAEGSKAFCSELCFTQCRRASFKKNKVCNWCKHVRHTVNYVDYFDGKNQLQFCSTKCLGQYKMNILCREIEMIPPRVLHSVHVAPTTDPTVNQSEGVVQPLLPVDLCMKRKPDRSCDTVNHTLQQRQLSPNIRFEGENRMHSSKRHKSCHKQSVESERKPDTQELRSSSSSSSSSAGLQTKEHENHLRTQQQLHLQQLQQLQTRMSLTSELLQRSLNQKESDPFPRHNLNSGRRDRSFESSSQSRLFSPALFSSHHRMPCSLLPSTTPGLGLAPTPLHNHHFPRPGPATSSHSLQQYYSPVLPPVSEQRDVLRSGLKSKPSAVSSSMRANSKKQAEHTVQQSTVQTTNTTMMSTRRENVCPPPAHYINERTVSDVLTPSLILPMPVVLPFPVPVPIPLFLFQQKVVQMIERLKNDLTERGTSHGVRNDDDESKSGIQKSDDKPTGREWHEWINKKWT